MPLNAAMDMPNGQVASEQTLAVATMSRALRCSNTDQMLHGVTHINALYE